MKAVIVEIRGETAAALGRDGSVFKVKNHAYAVGQTIDVRRGVSRQLAVLAAAAAAIFLIVGAGIHTYISPYSLVSLDVNPSLQYTLNRLGLVLSVEAVNGDGSDLLQEVGALNNRSIEDAISITVKQIAEDGYFDGEEPGGMVIAASSRDDQEAARLAENVKETALRATQESEKEVVVAAVTVAEDKVQAAKELGVSPGKLTLVEQLRDTASDPETIDFKEWLEKPVKDIMKETAAQHPESSTASSESGASSGGSASSGAQTPSAPGSSAGSAENGSSQEGSSLTPPDASSGAPASSEPPRSQTPLEPPPQSKPAPPAESEAEDAPSQAPEESGEGMSGESSEAASSEGSSAVSASSSPESGTETEGGSGTESSGSASHEAPSSAPTPLEPTDDWTPPTPSESSSRPRSSKPSPGYPLPYPKDPNESVPWWELMD